MVHIPKRDKKDKDKPAPRKVPPPRGLTHAGKRVWDFMNEHKTRGNFRDFVLFVGDQMYDAWGVYTITRKAAEGSDGAPIVALVHKRDLAKIIGPENAGRFWHPGTSKRTSYGAPRS
jgi:hypothetical protein